MSVYMYTFTMKYVDIVSCCIALLHCYSVFQVKDVCFIVEILDCISKCGLQISVDSSCVYSAASVVVYSYYSSRLL